MDYRDLVKEAVLYVLENYGNDKETAAEEIARDMAYSWKDEICEIYTDILSGLIHDELVSVFEDELRGIIEEIIFEEM